MQIYTVKPGDTIFKIARNHTTSPLKIIENNSLENPDKLTVGQKLLIIPPTRTYTVRGGDTLARIADRFNVELSALYKNNPYLCGKDKIYPGQLITVKHDVPRYGMAAANGYYSQNCTDEKLSSVLPHLTHITLPSRRWNGHTLEKIMKDEHIIRKAKEGGVIPLMRVYDSSERMANSDKFINDAINAAKEDGYKGITLASYSHMKKEPKAHSEFLMKLKKDTMAHDLLLFGEIDGNSPLPKIDDIYDGYSLMYERAGGKNIPEMGYGEEMLLNSASEIFEPSKTYIEIPSSAYENGEDLTVYEARKIASNSGKEIEYDDGLGICWFEYNKYRGGKKETGEVIWESPESIKAKFDLIGELGLMGMTVDIANIPTEYLMMYETMFHHPHHTEL